MEKGFPCDSYGASVAGHGIIWNAMTNVALLSFISSKSVCVLVRNLRFLCSAVERSCTAVQLTFTAPKDKLSANC